MNCRQVARMLASDDLAAAGWRTRLAVRLHLALCRHCRRYAAQLAAIGEAARNLFGRDPGAPHDLERAILDRCLEDRRTDASE
ncbi:MAG: anti-sigma factor [Acidobacteria bacterium]|nr:MAG: anti-sigma factor [Acidobacteriota bacterium]